MNNTPHTGQTPQGGDQQSPQKKNSGFHIKLPILLALAVAAGMLIGATMMNDTKVSDDLMNAVLKYREVMTYIQRDYVDETDPNELTETAIGKMLENLDPHSVYIPSKDRELSQSQLEGEFEGIGIEFNIIKDTIYVVSPLSGGPSEEVGLQAGDQIIKVDGKNVAGEEITNRNVIDMLRGEKGTKVTVSVKRRRSKELMDYVITRDKIPQYSVDVSYMIDKEVGYIKVSRFAATTYDEFKDAMKDLKGKGMKKLVLDLQGNPGGYMDRAINMADEMLEDNQLIVYTDGKQDRYDSRASARRRGMFEEEPVIVLINEGSASASEIVAGALQDNDRALIVGRRSFGKGLVQMPIELNDGSELRLTISRYYTPSGRSIQKPYNGNGKDYAKDIMDRYEHGEMFVADSVEFNDSLKYTTSKGRIVYGGGGIMPDYFVPWDTAYNSEYLNKLFLSNVIREYTLKYYEDNKKRLESMDYENFRNNYEVDQQMLNEVIRLGKESDIAYNEEEFKRSKDYMKRFMKAQIARSIWGNDGFYPIWNENNEALKQALTLFDEAEDLLEMKPKDKEMK